MHKKTILEDGGTEPAVPTITEGGLEVQAIPTKFVGRKKAQLRVVETPESGGWIHTSIPGVAQPFTATVAQPLQQGAFSARPQRKIAVCGSAASSVGLAPYDDPSWEIWSCSPANRAAPRVDVWFELHNPEVKVREGLLEWMEWLKTQPIVYMQRVYSGYKGSRAYPLQPMLEKWGPYLWTSQLSFMLALAIEQKPHTIGLFGVDMAANSEYNQQRLALQVLLQYVLKSEDITLMVPPESDILEPAPFYGYCESSRQWRKFYARRLELQQRISALTADSNKKAEEAKHLVGALDDMEYHLAHWATRMDFTE